MDRVKIIAYKIMDEFNADFSTVFETNKKVLDELVLVRSKQLRNEIAGFITKIKNSELSEDTSNVAHDIIQKPLLA